ncbi:MAG: CinA family nicotinamide mononucleotide deamidase-related protein [Myxococcales bacterium]|nr:CinA family nicotinamide mononucleotide deamidase-related protein [Myxococcales bacterium]
MYTPPGALSAEAAEIVTIGDELNRGEIVDTNSSWIAERLTAIGLHVRWRSSTTDDVVDMEAALRQAAGRARVVVCSGGLGPTDDDRTVDVMAAILGVAAGVDEGHQARMVARFAERSFLGSPPKDGGAAGPVSMTPNNLRQVRVPSGAEVLPNRAGLAPGFRVALRDSALFFVPGVPREMKRIFEEEIAPRLRALCGDGRATAKRTWRVAGMGESHVDHQLRGLLDGIAGATLHFRIAYPENLVTVVVRRPAREEAEAVITALDSAVRARLGGAVYGIDDETLATVIGRRLRARGETVATAESCTGGLCGDLLTDVPGSSDYFLGGVIAYANPQKESLLGVRRETLERHGAVSEACVREMAEGVRRTVGATFGVAISGIAGPGGGSAEKPVGLVHFAVAGPSGIEARKLVWPSREGDPDGRRMVKQLAAFAALNLLEKLLAPPGSDRVSSTPREEGPRR